MGKISIKRQGVKQQQNYKDKNYIPNVSLAFTNFEEFFSERSIVNDSIEKRTYVNNMADSQSGSAVFQDWRKIWQLEEELILLRKRWKK
jgi:hypothetical protein